MAFLLNVGWGVGFLGIGIVALGLQLTRRSLVMKVDRWPKGLMRVLTIYAHHDPRSFCHAVLQRFTEGLRDAGHTTEVVDLYAIGFDPVLRDHDRSNWGDDNVPDECSSTGTSSGP